MSAPLPDLEQAARFIRTLTDGNVGTFQSFSDRDSLKRTLPNGKLIDSYAHWKHGNLDALAPHLTRLNAQGVGIHMMVNEGDSKGRSAQSVVRVRALFSDFDGSPLPSRFDLRPHIITESSAGKFHVYWLIDGVGLDDFPMLQQCLAEHYGADPSVKDTCRVMRLPGFFHSKAEPVMVQLLEANSHPAYSASDVFIAWPFLAARLEQVKVQEAHRAREHAKVLRRAAERRANPTAATVDRERAERLLQAHHDTVASAPIGQRNVTLCRSAFTIGGYCASGYLDVREAKDLLLAASNVCGLPEAEARNLIDRALAQGMERPLELKPTATPQVKARSRRAPLYARMREWQHHG